MPPASFRERADQRVATALDTRAVDRLSQGRGRRSLARIAAVAVATLVHGAVLALVVGGGWLLVEGSSVVLRIVGAFVLLPAVALVRLGANQRSDALEPAELPELSRLLAELAGALGTRAPTVVRIDGDTNAHAALTGFRTRLLVVGAPLWVALSPQARLALLGHELGHFAGRDVEHGRYVGLALRTLTVWASLATPEWGVSTRGRTPVFSSIVTWPLRAAALSLRRLLWWCTATASRIRELQADTAAALVAGTPAIVELLECLLLLDVVDVAANRAAIDPARPDLAGAIRTAVERQDRSARRAARVTGEESRVDHSHPRTADRLRLQESLPVAAPAVVLDPDRVAAIDAELRPFLDAAMRHLADQYRYVR